MKRTDPNYVHPWKGKKFSKEYRKKIAKGRANHFGYFIDGNVYKCSKCQEIKPKSEFYTNDSITEIRLPCKKCQSKYTKDLRKKEPWKLLFFRLRSKCKKGYGKNIKCLFTSSDEIKFLWIRDKANYLNCPSIDRVNNDEHYCLDNCRFIEKKENSWKMKHIDYPSQSHELNCIRCNEKFTVKHSRFLKNPKFCSLKCRLNKTHIQNT